MKRKTLINLHLYFSSVSLFLLFLFICSGSLHLFGIKEKESTEQIERLSLTKKLSKSELKTLFKDQLKIIDPDYRYDYLKGDSQSLITRPTTRTYYRVTYQKETQSLNFSKHIPNFNKRLMEFHKGHGPKKSRKILAFIGMIFALAVITGFWLGVSVKAYRKTTLLASATSLLILVTLFNL